MGDAKATLNHLLQCMNPPTNIKDRFKEEYLFYTSEERDGGKWRCNLIDQATSIVYGGVGANKKIALSIGCAAALRDLQRSAALTATSTATATTPAAAPVPASVPAPWAPPSAEAPPPSCEVPSAKKRAGCTISAYEGRKVARVSVKMFSMRDLRRALDSIDALTLLQMDEPDVRTGYSPCDITIRINDIVLPFGMTTKEVVRRAFEGACESVTYG